MEDYLFKDSTEGKLVGSAESSAEANDRDLARLSSAARVSDVQLVQWRLTCLWVLSWKEAVPHH